MPDLYGCIWLLSGISARYSFYTPERLGVPGTFCLTQLRHRAYRAPRTMLTRAQSEHGFGGVSFNPFLVIVYSLSRLSRYLRRLVKVWQDIRRFFNLEAMGFDQKL